MLRTALFTALMFALPACYVEETPAYPEAGPAALAVVEPGIEVVIGTGSPVFFVDDLYWRWYGGYWYSSPYWTGGWVYAPHPPGRVHGIAHPDHYSQYHPAHGHPTRPAPRPGRGRHHR